jgi:peptidoglycan hydrolase CwlO-like protein
MPQLRRQAAKWWLRPPPRPLPDMGLKKWWTVFLALVLVAGFAVSAFIKGYSYLDSLISPSPPSTSAEISQFQSDLRTGQQQLEIINKEVADATARLEKLQTEINDPKAISKPTEQDVAEAKQDMEEKAQLKKSIQRAVDEKKAKLDALEHLPVVETMSPN